MFQKSHYTSTKSPSEHLSDFYGDDYRYINVPQDKDNKIWAIHDIVYINNLKEKPVITPYSKKLLVLDFEEYNDFDTENFILYIPVFLKHMNTLDLESFYINLYDKCVGSDKLQNILKIFNFIADHLRYLNFNFRMNNLDKNSGKLISQYIQKCELVESVCLNLKFNNLKSEGFHSIIKAFQDKTRMESLHLDLAHNHISGLQNGFFPQNLQSLYLNLTSNRINEQFAIKLGGMLFRCNFLVSLGLNFSECELDCNKITTLSEGIGKISNLQILSLNISWNDIKEDGFVSLSSNIEHLPKIKSLSLDFSSNTFNPTACIKTMKSLENLNFLENLYLNLQSSSLNNSSTQDMGNSLIKMTNLRILTLWFDSVTQYQSLQNQIRTMNLEGVSLFPKPTRIKNSVDQSFVPEKAAAMIPYMSPYFKMKQFSKLGSCCHPYTLIREYFDFKLLKKQAQIQIKDLESSGSNISIDDKKQVFGVLNNLQNDRHLFDIFVRNCQEIGILGKLNLLIVNCNTKKKQFNTEEIQIQQKIPGFIAKITQQQREDSEPEYQFELKARDFIERYTIKMEKQLGTCAYGLVYEGYDTVLEQKVAIKSINIKNDLQDETLLHQLELHQKSSSSKRVVTLINFCRNQILDIINGQHITTYLIALEFGTPLMQHEINQMEKDGLYNSKITPQEYQNQVQKSIYQMISITKCIKHLHDKKLVHLNINHRKFVVSPINERVSLTDLGQIRVQMLKKAESMKEISEKFKVEDPGFKERYASPEIKFLLKIPKFRREMNIKDKGGLYFYLNKSDIYQMGLLFLHMVGLRLQRNNKKFMDFQNQIDFQFSELDSEDIEIFREQFIEDFDANTIQLINLKNLIKKMLSYKPENRPDIEQVLEYLYSKEII